MATGILEVFALIKWTISWYFDGGQQFPSHERDKIIDVNRPKNTRNDEIGGFE